MSRTAAKEKFRWSHVKPLLESAGVQLLSAGIDEVPGAYKDIHTVMSQQQDYKIQYLTEYITAR